LGTGLRRGGVAHGEGCGCGQHAWPKRGGPVGRGVRSFMNMAKLNWLS